MMRATFQTFIVISLVVAFLPPARAQDDVAPQDQMDDQWWLRINDLSRQEREEELRDPLPEGMRLWLRELELGGEAGPERARRLLRELQRKGEEMKRELPSWRMDDIERSMQWEELERRLRPRKPNRRHSPLAIT